MIRLEEDEELISCEDIIEDETEDNNLRFIGEDPSNYVKFSEVDEELWRIIGVFNNIVTSTGETETLIKIIKKDSIGNCAWDSSNSNDWTTSSLQKALNGEDTNTTSTDCSLSLSKTQSKMIESVVWTLGGVGSSYTTATAKDFYTAERGTTVYSGHETKWTGKIALMYPSDYGFATSGGDTKDRDTCLAKELYNWDEESYSDCYTNDWLHESSYSQWTLTPCSGNSHYVFNVNNTGNVNNNANNNNGVRPAAFLRKQKNKRRCINQQSKY